MLPLRLLHIEDSALQRQVFRSNLRGVENISIIGQLGVKQKIPAEYILNPPDVLAISQTTIGQLSHSLHGYPLSHKGITVSKSELISFYETIFNSKISVELINEKVPAEKLAEQMLTSKNRISIETEPSNGFPSVRNICSYKTPIIAIGASTGGVDALSHVLSAFPENCAPTLIVQHMKSAFLAGFTSRLNMRCHPDVLVANDNSLLDRGKVYIAPGTKHLQVVKGRTQLSCHLLEKDVVSGHKPSIDVLFTSLSELPNPKIAVLLTGMGRDGAQGMLEVRLSGGKTIVQDELSSVVYGMPRAAMEIGAADIQLPLGCIGNEIVSTARKMSYSD